MLEKLDKEYYNLILMDIQMPKIDGYTATRKIRKTGNSTPIIALTAQAMKGDKDKCIEAGMDDYLSKPINKKKLYDVIDKYRNKKKIV